jgi:predicted nucleic acid-binding protein
VSLVLDGSATLAWLYPDESTDMILAVFDEVIRKGATVPWLWRIEVANSLTMAVRRDRVTIDERAASLADLDQLMIVTDRDTELHLWTDALLLADRHRLTVYDATYLELAVRLSLPLATLDKDLRKAAQRERIPLLGK